MLKSTSAVAVVRPGIASCSSSIPSERTNPATTVRRRDQPKDQSTAEGRAKRATLPTRLAALSCCVVQGASSTRSARLLDGGSRRRRVQANGERRELQEPPHPPRLHARLRPASSHLTRCRCGRGAGSGTPPCSDSADDADDRSGSGVAGVALIARVGLHDHEMEHVAADRRSVLGYLRGDDDRHVWRDRCRRRS